MNEIIELILTDRSLRTVALGTALMGAAAGSAGAFAFLRKRSLAGDVIAHSSLLGIVVAFLIGFWITGTGVKNSAALMIGAAGAGALASWAISAVLKNSRIKSDAAFGIMLAVFFGIGIFILKMIQQRAVPNHAGLQDYIFGMAAAITSSDLIVIAVVAGIVFLSIGAFWKELKTLTFDREFIEASGFSASKIETILTILIVLSVSVSLQAAGVVLTVALIAAPPSAARQWTNKLSTMVVLSGFIGAVSGALGAVLSSEIPNLPTGPTITLILTGIFIFSALFSPTRGALPKLFKRFGRSKNVFLDRAILDLYLLETNHESGSFVGHSANALKTMNARNAALPRTLSLLETLEMAKLTDRKAGLWALTEKGKKRAKDIIEKRIKIAND